MVYAVVRVRGTIKIKPDIKKTLRFLRLNKVNHCVLIVENDVYKGMLQTAKDYVTWGELSKDMVSKLITARGMLSGDKPVTEDHVKTSTSYKTIETLSEAITSGKFAYKEIPEIKPVFRLHPPKNGYEGIKRSYPNGGALGYRGKEINKLIERML